MIKEQNMINKHRNYRLSRLICALTVVIVSAIFMACGKKMGKIDLENVEVVIAQSEIALDQAYLTNAKLHSPQLVKSAEQQIDSAKKAKDEKDGLTALQKAYYALVDAQVATQEAMAISREKELNNLLDERSRELKKIKAEIRKSVVELKQTRSKMESISQQKDESIEKLEQTIQEKTDEIRQSKSQIIQAQKNQSKLQGRYNEIQVEYDQAKNKIKKYQKEVRQYQNQLDKAKSEVELARRISEKAKNKAIVQGEKYSKQIEYLNQGRTVLEDHDLLLDQKIREARAFVENRQVTSLIRRTGATSLSQNQIANAQRTLELWNQDWWNKRVEAHLGYYSPQIQVEQTIIQTNGEKYSSLNHQQMKSVIRQMAHNTWTQQASIEKPKIVAEGDNLIANYRLHKPSGYGQTQPILYDIWEREVWIEEQNEQWYIQKEIWRIYKDVPKY